jgi:hypothetical protein
LILILLDTWLDAKEVSRVESMLLHKDKLLWAGNGRNGSFRITGPVILLMLLLEDSEYLGEYLLAV